MQKHEQRINELRRERAHLYEQKQRIDNAFVRLQTAIAELLDTRRITPSTELDALRRSIELADVQGVCTMVHDGLGTDSLDVYHALLNVLDSTPDTLLLPLNESISTTTDLHAQLRAHLQQATNFVVLNDVIRVFMGELSQAQIDLSMTPFEYQQLENAIADHDEELRQEQVELDVEQATPPVVGSDHDPQTLKRQLEQQLQALAPQVRDLREKIEETVRTLEAGFADHLSKIWSSDALSYLQEQGRLVDIHIASLKRNQSDMEQRKSRLQDQLMITVPVSTDESVARSEAISQFQQHVSYIKLVADSPTNEERDAHLIQDALTSLNEAGLAELLKYTIDKFITERCKYYYDNAIQPCRPLPLDAVVYEQNDRKTPTFIVNGKQFPRTQLSGGTESVMTVRSLASRPSFQPFGLALLVDEWGDVEHIGEPLYAELRNMLNVLTAVFVKVEDIPTINARTVN